MLIVARLLFAVRVIFAVVVAAVVLGLVVTPGSGRPSSNPIVAGAQGVVEGMAAFGRGMVDLAGATQHPRH